MLYTWLTELTFKQPLRLSALGATLVAFFMLVENTIYIYSDESGVFDYIHNEYFLFAGLIFFGKDSKEIGARKYAHAEKCVRNNQKGELKGSRISNAKKGKLYRSLNKEYKFCVMIDQKNINHKIFEDKKSKQRYLDYAYKIIIKKCMELLIKEKMISAKKIKFMFVNADEHVTATDGKYELRESLLQEFKIGVFNFNYEKYYRPVFPSLVDVVVNFCDSKTNYLIRAADIICNHCYHVAIKNKGDLDKERNMFIYYLPANYIGNKGLEYFLENDSEIKN